MIETIMYLLGLKLKKKKKKNSERRRKGKKKTTKKKKNSWNHYIFRKKSYWSTKTQYYHFSIILIILYEFPLSSKIKQNCRKQNHLLLFRNLNHFGIRKKEKNTKQVMFGCYIVRYVIKLYYSLTAPAWMEPQTLYTNDGTRPWRPFNPCSCTNTTR